MSTEISVPRDMIVAFVTALMSEDGFEGERLEWDKMLSSLPVNGVRAWPGSADHFLNIYQPRLDWNRKNNSSIVGQLEKMVSSFTAHTGRDFIVTVIDFEGYGYVLWMDAELTRIVTYFRGKSKRESL